MLSEVLGWVLLWAHQSRGARGGCPGSGERPGRTAGTREGGHREQRPSAPNSPRNPQRLQCGAAGRRARAADPRLFAQQLDGGDGPADGEPVPALSLGEFPQHGGDGGPARGPAALPCSGTPACPRLPRPGGSAPAASRLPFPRWSAAAAGRTPINPPSTFIKAFLRKAGPPDADQKYTEELNTKVCNAYWINFKRRIGIKINGTVELPFNPVILSSEITENICV